MKQQRTTVHIHQPTPDEHALLRLLTPAEKLAALVRAAREKAARISAIDSQIDSQKRNAAPAEEADTAF